MSKTILKRKIKVKCLILLDSKAYYKVILIKTSWCVLKKLKIESSYDLVILLLNTHPKEWKELPEGRFIHLCSRQLIHNS